LLRRPVGTCPPRGLHVFTVIRLVQDAVAQALIFMLALAAKFYDALAIISRALIALLGI
jgi:hypothetical protein